MIHKQLLFKKFLLFCLRLIIIVVLIIRIFIWGLFESTLLCGMVWVIVTTIANRYSDYPFNLLEGKIQQYLAYKSSIKVQISS